MIAYLSCRPQGWWLDDALGADATQAATHNYVLDITIVQTILICFNHCPFHSKATTSDSFLDFSFLSWPKKTVCDSITRQAVIYLGVPLRVVLPWSILQSLFQGTQPCYPEKSTEVDLTSGTPKLASRNLHTLGCPGVSNLPAVDFRVDYRLLFHWLQLASFFSISGWWWQVRYR